MSELISLSIGSIATLAFSTLIKDSSKEIAKKFTSSVLQKIDNLREQIWTKLQGIPTVDELKIEVTRTDQVSQQQIRLLTPHLESAMNSDADFRQRIQKLAYEIHQQINIDEIIGKNIQNIYGGSATQVNDPEATVFTGDVSGGTFNINHY